MGLKETVKQLWIKKMEKEYERLLSGKKVSYDTWIRQREVSAPETDGEVVEYTLLLQKDGTLSGQAHALITKYFRENPQVQILYGDEDFMTEDGRRENPK